MMKNNYCIHVVLLVLWIMALTSCNQGAPRIGAVEIADYPVSDNKSLIILSCTVLSAAHSEVASVTADVSPIGGSPAAALVNKGNDVWQWSGIVTLPEPDNTTINITAKDNFGRTGSIASDLPALISYPVGFYECNYDEIEYRMELNISEYFEIPRDSISLDSTLSDLGGDRVSIYEILLYFETAFKDRHISFPEGAVDALLQMTVRQASYYTFNLVCRVK